MSNNSLSSLCIWAFAELAGYCQALDSLVQSQGLCSAQVSTSHVVSRDQPKIGRHSASHQATLADCMAGVCSNKLV